MLNDPEIDFQDYWKQFGKKAHVFRFTDSSEVHGMNKGRKGVNVKAQPSDFLVTYNDCTFYAEVKSSKNKTSFPFGNIRATQMSHAIRVYSAGGRYDFYLKNLNTGQWYVVPAKIIHEISKTKSSVKWSELGEYKCPI